MWFRSDLRTADNPALSAALARGGPVVPVFIWSPEEEGRWPPGAASRWWLHHSLVSLDASLRGRSSRLIIRRGTALAALRALVKECGAQAVYWNRRYEPAGEKIDAAVTIALADDGVAVTSFHDSLLRAPDELATGSGKPFQVFTPFARAHEALPPPPAPLPSPKSVRAPSRWPHSDPVESLALLPSTKWDGGLTRAWAPGETGAAKALSTFINGALEIYAVGRDQPARPGTSRLSPHLHFGEISPRQIHARLVKAPRHPASAASRRRFHSEILWREFAAHLLHHFPRMADHPLRPAFEKFPWRAPGTSLKRWQRGQTGYPIVDAGMRELWHTGWMHNRVRMVVASFLVKDLGIDWRSGAAWFWDTLVDADLANNTLGWQWSAGCGADAAPFFRIFNPILQGEKFDADGTYVATWVPELKKLPARWIHKPWRAPEEVLLAAGVTIGESYPAPMIDHARAREAALFAFKKISRIGAAGVPS